MSIMSLWVIIVITIDTLYTEIELKTTVSMSIGCHVNNIQMSIDSKYQKS